jgi:catechol 2,3-dioxygenase-like lactoylglutathione lyase family enzyme
MSRFDAVTIEVADLERSLAFYRLIGLAIPEGRASSYATLELPGQGRVDWTRSARCSTSAPPRIVLGVRCRDADELDRVHRSLVDGDHAVEAAPHVVAWGARVCRAMDPDGNIVELYAPLP